jgi:hypothetical protein
VRQIGLLLAALSTVSAHAQTPQPSAADFRKDALSVEPLINARYAYLDRLPGGRYALPAKLHDEAESVHDAPSLLRFAEHAVALLADHHAITGRSFPDSWALVPSYADIWVERDAGGYLVTDVRAAMPAEGKIAAGARIVSVGGLPIEDAVRAYWQTLAIDTPTDGQRANAARILLAGRRDRDRTIGFVRAGAPPQTLTLPNLYTALAAAPHTGPVTTTRRGTVTRIHFNNSLGDDATIPAFDAAMAAVPAGDTVVVDLTDTGSGGNTTVARAVIGWFTATARPYQMHASPEEMRRTGIARQWAEYVLPRPGKHFGGKHLAGRVVVQVGRWTGSMGEGLGTGFDALGVPVCGTAMAGLLGAIEDNRLEHSGLVIKFPTERLWSMAGVPREDYRPRLLGDPACRPARDAA